MGKRQENNEIIAKEFFMFTKERLPSLVITGEYKTLRGNL